MQLAVRERANQNEDHGPWRHPPLRCVLHERRPLLFGLLSIGVCGRRRRARVRRVPIPGGLPRAVRALQRSRPQLTMTRKLVVLTLGLTMLVGRAAHAGGYDTPI